MMVIETQERTNTSTQETHFHKSLDTNLTFTTIRLDIFGQSTIEGITVLELRVDGGCAQALSVQGVG